MIAALEALRLERAKLSAAQRSAATELAATLDAFIRERMERRGCEFATRQTDANVVAEVIRETKAAGWSVQAQAMAEPSQFGGQPRIVGYVLSLAPRDEVYPLADAPPTILQ